MRRCCQWLTASLTLHRLTSVYIWCGSDLWLVPCHRGGFSLLLRCFSCTLEIMQLILIYISGWGQTGSFISHVKKRNNPTGAQFLSVSSQENKTAHYFQNLALGSLFVLKLLCAWQSRCSQEMRHPVFYRTTLLHQLMLVIHPETLILERNAIFATVI